MLHVGTDKLDVIGSFNFQMKESRDGRVYISAMAPDSAILKSVHYMLFKGSTYETTNTQASYIGRVGVAVAAVASACVGWFQIRGFCSDVQSSNEQMKGSYGHAVYMSAAGIAASTSAYMGLNHQFAILAQDIGGGGCNTANMWIIGREDITPLA